MKEKLIAIVVGLIIIVSMTIYIDILNSKLDKQRIEIENKDNNIAVLNLGFKSFQTRDSLNAATVSVLRYNTDDLRHFNSEMINELKDLKLRLKSVENALKIEISTKDTIKEKTFVKFIGKDTAYCFKKDTEFLKLSGCSTKDSTIIDYQSFVNLSAYVTTEKTKKFLFFRYGKKVTNLTVVSDNPKTTIKNVSFIEVVK